MRVVPGARCERTVLVSISRVTTVEPTQQPGPHQRPWRNAPRRHPDLLLDAVENRLRDGRQLSAAGLGTHLNHAGHFKEVHGDEGVCRRGADRQQAMVAQHQISVGAEVLNEARLLALH